MTDIIHDRVFGTTRRNILRIIEVPSDKKFGEQISIKYDNIQYIQLNTNRFSKIEIKIRKKINYGSNLEREGEHILDLRSGTLLLTLHFKKKSDQVLKATAIPTISTKGKRDYLFIEAAIPKITAEYKNKIVPFTCDPLKYLNCKPSFPYEIKNIEQVEEHIKEAKFIHTNKEI
jgi:hypothetical protein